MRMEETCRTGEDNGHAFSRTGYVGPCQALCHTNALPQGLWYLRSSVSVSPPLAAK